MQSGLGTGHRHIKHPTLFFNIRIQKCLMMGRHRLVGIHNKHNLIFQSFGMMHGRQCHTICLLFTLLSGLLTQLLCIFFNMTEPFLIGCIISGTILKFVQKFQKILSV